jgi:glutamate 5-kinase
VDRLKLLKGVRRAVVKIGTGVLTDENGKIDRKVAQEIARQCERMLVSDRQVALVSSGAIALGRAQLALETRPKKMDALQACAAVGQSQLIRLWGEAFAPFGRTVAQVLLTHADLAHRQRFLNARRCLFELSARGAIAVINENDTVSVEEIAFGDNDALSGQVANLLNADLLIMLSIAPGLLDGDRCVSEVPHGDKRIDRLIWKDRSSSGTGGMTTKVAAARSVAARGGLAIIAPGKIPGVLDRLFAGDELGTLFLPAARAMSSRAQWIAHTLRAKGSLSLDPGAVEAVVVRNRSLLPTGIVGIEGNFGRGDPVDLTGPTGSVFARGLSTYSSAELGRIQGKRTREIFDILGYHLGDEVIHRDDLVILKPSS